MKNSVDINILKSIVAKIYKAKMPSIIQVIIILIVDLLFGLELNSCFCKINQY